MKTKEISPLTSVREWYIRRYPQDKGVYNDFNPAATFEGVYKCLEAKFDIYAYLGNIDSIVRERVFDGLAVLMDCSYDIIYNQWQKTLFSIECVTDLKGKRFANNEK